MARQRSDLEQVRRFLYKTQRGIGTYQAYRRGGIGAVLLRLARRRTNRWAGRHSDHWV